MINKFKRQFWAVISKQLDKLTSPITDVTLTSLFCYNLTSWRKANSCWSLTTDAWDLARRQFNRLPACLCLFPSSACNTTLTRLSLLSLLVQLKSKFLKEKKTLLPFRRTLSKILHDFRCQLFSIEFDRYIQITNVTDRHTIRHTCE